jgi:hypothetical protein
MNWLDLEADLFASTERRLVISLAPLEKTGDPLDAIDDPTQRQQTADNDRARERVCTRAPLADDSGGAQRSAVAAFLMRRTPTMRRLPMLPHSG